MKETTKAFEEELKGVDAALRRAAIKAKEEAERLGTPYVLNENKSNDEPQQMKSESKQ